MATVVESEYDAMRACSFLRAQFLRCGAEGQVGLELDARHARLTKLQTKLRDAGRPWPEVLVAMQQEASG